MTKEVLVNISGLQFDIDNDDNVEILTPGQYYYRNGRHFITYDEYLDSSSDTVTKNTVKILPNRVEITKRGLGNAHMVFEKDNDSVTYYDTPFGSLLIGISTQNISINEGPDNIDIMIQYDLSMNYNHISNCDINIKIKSQN